eukprot:10388609-Lingulodinium_polyedra.AAC.1
MATNGEAWAGDPTSVVGRQRVGPPARRGREAPGNVGQHTKGCAIPHHRRIPVPAAHQGRALPRAARAGGTGVRP